MLFSLESPSLVLKYFDDDGGTFGCYVGGTVHFNKKTIYVKGIMTFPGSVPKGTYLYFNQNLHLLALNHLMPLCHMYSILHKEKI